MFSIGFTSLSVLLLFSLSITFFVFVHVFDSISSNIDEVLSINPSRSTDEVLLINFNVHHKDWLTYSGGTDRLVNSVIVFLSQITLFRWLIFLLGFQTVILIVLLFWIYLFLLVQVFVLQWLSLLWEILIMLLAQFPLIFHQILNGMPCFIA